ncbi:MAG: hypothetical protein AB7S26_34430 [Sandaracinaceae bacterium]
MKRGILGVIGTLTLLGLGCGGGRAQAEHAEAEDEPHPAHRTVAPPEAQIAFVHVVEGPLEEAAARGALASIRPRVHACLAATSIRVEGHAVVHLEVAPDGSVTRSGTDHVDGIDPELAFCVVRAVRESSMPARESASVVQIGFDFTDPREIEVDTAQPEAELSDEEPGSTDDGGDDGADGHGADDGADGHGADGHGADDGADDHGAALPDDAIE